MNDGPLARRDGLVVKTVGDEVLVYDLERARAHSLDALAAAIWRRCDGRRPVAALAAAVRAETGVPVTAAAVEYGLAALGRARLLAGERPAPGPTRRQVLARIGTAAAIPLVLSITAPTAAQAQSQTCLVFLAVRVSAGGAPCCPLLTCIAPGNIPCSPTSPPSAFAPTLEPLIARVLAGAWRAAPPPPDFTAEDVAAAAPLLHKSGAGALTWWRIRGTPARPDPDRRGLPSGVPAPRARGRGPRDQGRQRPAAPGRGGPGDAGRQGLGDRVPYPEVGRRQYTDLDVVIRPGEMGAARAALADLPVGHYPVDLHAGRRPSTRCPPDVTPLTHALNSRATPRWRGSLSTPR